MDSLLCSLIDDSISYLLQTNSDKANELIDRIREIQKHAEGIAKSSGSKDKSEMLVQAGSGEQPGAHARLHHEHRRTDHKPQPCYSLN